MSPLKDVPCCVEGCDRMAMYSEARLCQKHYFRKMRNGHFELKKRKLRSVEKTRGYVMLVLPDHPLADNRGNVREHRVVYHDKVCSNPTACEMCQAPITWANLHIDHKDEVTGNNEPDNLRALCRACNVFRAHTSISMGTTFIEIDGLKLVTSAWARMPGVKVCGGTIRYRKKKGWSDYDAVYAERRTHNTCPPAKQRITKYDSLRGIPTNC